MSGKREKPFKLNMPFGEALGRFASTRPDEAEQAVRAEKQANMIPKQGELELVHYRTPECQADFTLDPSNETVWATQQQIAAAFGVASNTVTEHLKNIFREGELNESAVARRFRARGKDGKEYNLLHYSLDAILSVGYRVSSKRATAFRQWATRTLKDYIVQGFALNEARLRDDPHALRALAAKVRALRADEKNIYQAVRDVFAFGSSNYDPKAQEAKAFFARLQDKFLYAITGQTAARLILGRADADERTMGLQVTVGEQPTAAEIHVDKDYLASNELCGLHILCEQFLLFVESRALRGLSLTMAEMSQKFDELLRVQGYPVFSGYQEYLKGRAVAHAKRELQLYQNKIAGLPASENDLRKLGNA